MASVNRIALVGHVGAPAELRYRTNGSAVTLFRLATDRMRASGPRAEEAGGADWHTVEVEGGLGLARNDAARRASVLLRKGTEAYVEGSLAYRVRGSGPVSGLEAVVLATRVEVLSQPAVAAGTDTQSDGADRPLAVGRVAVRKARRVGG